VTTERASEVRKLISRSDVPSREAELTILMPCLNEAETVAICIDKARSFLTRACVNGEIVIADNGSADGSQSIAVGLGARVVDISSKGYGAALLGGIAAARGRYIIMGDADDSYDFSSLDAFLKELRDGAELVMGNRFKGEIAPNAMPGLHRYLGNPFLSFLGRLFFHIPVGDFYCGLRGFRADVIRGLKLRTAGMEFAIEMVVRSALAGLKIVEVPTTLKPDGRSRAPHLKTWRDGWRGLKFLLIYSPRWLFMIPGACLVGIGALLAVLLSLGPRRLPQNIVLDLTSFVTACFMLMVGVQVLMLGGLSRYYATITGFLPHSPRAKALLRHLTTDRLVWLSVAFFVVGFLMFGAASAVWAQSSFGPITSPLVPRTAIAGLTFMVIGVQTFFSAFLLGVLEIPVVKHENSAQVNATGEPS
jgi:Glycosyl transferase family 2